MLIVHCGCARALLTAWLSFGDGWTFQFCSVLMRRQVLKFVWRETGGLVISYLATLKQFYNELFSDLVKAFHSMMFSYLH